jgi:hypothetical protein
MTRFAGHLWFTTTFAFVVLPAIAAHLAGAADAAKTSTRVFRESSESFPNPERGFYTPRNHNQMTGLNNLRKQGISLLLVEMNLREFKDRDLTPAKLDELRRAFESARTHGLKIIFRAAYGFTNRDYRADPKDMSRILGHIRQLGAVFGENRDVLAGVQAGFLGPWGEWHGSNWGDPPSLEARRAVLFGLLDAVPQPITVHIRRPMFIRDIFANEPGGSELSEKTAFSGSRLSRTGLHDDAFLALPDDMGTFAQRGWNRQRELDWCNRHGRFTPFGGETVGPAANTPIEQVIREMELFHTTYLNIAYHPRVLRRWRESEYKGENTFAVVAQRLGYRFVAKRLDYTPELKPGESLHFDLTLANVGFASPHLPRHAVVGVWHGADPNPIVQSAFSDADPRLWGPEAGLVHVRGEIRLPGNAPTGDYRLGLLLADPSDRLRLDGRYAIRLADEEIPFSEKEGWNTLVDNIHVR